MGKTMCVKNYLMENGPAAFLAGREYEWRWASEIEQDETGCCLAIDGELGPDHFISMIDYLNYFKDVD